MTARTGRALLFSLLCLGLLAVLASPASAGCTASINCNNACSISLFCPAPYTGCEVACAAPTQFRSCSGNTSCTVGTGSVTCDGTTFACPTQPQCTRQRTAVSCGLVTKLCSNRNNCV
jgi:hypothetical protein